MWLKRIGNVLVQDDDVVHGYVVRFTKPRTYASDVEHTSLESVEVSNNVVVVQDETDGLKNLSTIDQIFVPYHY